jgi:transcriptional regulator with XRE-family HTH domain
MVEFARHLGCTHSTISGYESEKITPSASMLLLLLPLAQGSERKALLDALGVEKDQQEGWAPGEIERELEVFEGFVSAGGRQTPNLANPRREFVDLAKDIAGDKTRDVPPWLVEVLRFWIKFRDTGAAVEFFQHLPIYLDVQTKTLKAGAALSNPAAALSKARRKGTTK